MKTRISLLWTVAACLFIGAFSAQGQAAGRASGALVESQKDQIEAVTQPKPRVRKAKPAPELEMKAPKPAKASKAAAKKKETITRVVFTGDADWLAGLQVKDAAGRIVNAEAIRQEILDDAADAEGQGAEVVLERCRQILAENGGFYLLRFQPEVKGGGELVVRVDAGRIDQIHLGYKEDGVRHFSGQQILRRFKGVTNNAIFDYNLLFDGFYAANTHPDLTVDAHLSLTNATRTAAQVRKAEEKGEPRLVDLYLSVEDRLPIHVMMDVDNYGTEVADNWTARLTVQHVNLTKADDVLTVNFQAPLDWGSEYGLAASYLRPYHVGPGGSWTVYGGYNYADFDEVIPFVDVKGEGWFGGAQASVNLLENRQRRLDAAVGFIHRFVENKIYLDGEKMDAAEVTLRPMSAMLIYGDKQADALNGLNFATLEAAVNVGDFMGTSDRAEMEAQRMNADDDYAIFKFQLARLQLLGSGLFGDGSWMLYAKLNGQVADGALIPAEQMGIGGANSVRGYEDREYAGDHAVIGTLELRTPLLTGLLHKVCPTISPKFDRTQFVAFADAGYMKMKDPLEGETEDETLASLGLGLRIALSTHAQLRMDWGFPLEETEASDHSGRGYIQLQVQF